MYKNDLDLFNCFVNGCVQKGIRYRTVYADPPWYERGGGHRGADEHYPIMKTADIISMGEGVKKIIDDNSHCYLWVTNNFIKDGLAVLDAWGFRYVTMITWIKNQIGLGQYFRGLTEHCLFGVKGVLPYKKDANGKRLQGVTGFFADKKEHSVKPDKMRQMILDVSYAPYLELFARKKHSLFDCFGNELI